MPKKLTTYLRPSLALHIVHCLDEEQLEKFYAKITSEAKDASPKTRKRWQELYERQKQLIRIANERAERQPKHEPAPMAVVEQPAV